VDGGSLLFNGSLLSTWSLNQSATSNRVASVVDPAGTSLPTLSFTTYNDDIAPLTPTLNPRSQLVSPDGVLTPGDTYWESFDLYLPASFPTTQPADGWITLQTPVYGSPYSEPPPAEIYIAHGQIRFGTTSDASPYSLPWYEPIVEQTWIDFTWHFLVSSSESTGWIELYVNGVQVPLNDGNGTVSRLPIALIDPGDAAGPWFSQLQLYYAHNEFPSLNVLYSEFHIATTESMAVAMTDGPSQLENTPRGSRTRHTRPQARARPRARGKRHSAPVAAAVLQRPPVTQSAFGAPPSPRTATADGG
jgi:hypothetical protein